MFFSVFIICLIGTIMFFWSKAIVIIISDIHKHYMF